MAAPIFVNGRFLHHSPTGVQVYAREITQRLGEAQIIEAPSQCSRGLPGHLWEQFALPRQISPADLLWSPANTGPLSVSNQVLTLHDVSVVEHPEWYAPSFSLWYRFLLPRLARKVKAIITGSNFSKTRIVERLNASPDKVTVIPYGVGERFHPRREAQIEKAAGKYGLPGIYVLAIGPLQPRKNLARLLRAWGQICASFPGVWLVIAGEGDRVYRPPDLGDRPERVKFLGRIDEERLPALYSGATAFVYPSLYEGFGLPVLEAMACGAPIIASGRGGLPEVIGEGGILVDPENMAEIADTLAALLTNPSKREALKSRGLARAQSFSWDDAAQKTWRVLNSTREALA